MKKTNYLYVILLILMLFLTTSCSIKTDNLEDSTIYTTVYPINYLANYLYGDYATISSIYPNDCDIDSYELNSKQIKKYASGDLFIYNGLTKEKDLSKEFINQNKNLLIIDASKGINLQNNIAELWLSPTNYLMLAKNIKNNLEEYLTSKYIIEEVEKNYNDFEEKISVMDANLHSLGKASSEKNKNTIIASNSIFKYLEKYGFNVISLDNETSLKENKLNTIKNNFKNGKYTYLLVADIDSENDIIKDLIANYHAKSINVNTLTLSLNEDYFEIMTKYIENIKTITS